MLSASLKQSPVVRTVFSVRMQNNINSKGAQKLTDWLLKLDRQFGLRGVSWKFNITFEAPRSTWASLEVLKSFKHVFDISGPNDMEQFQSRPRQSFNQASRLNSLENFGPKGHPASTHGESDTRILRQIPMNVARETTPNVICRNAQSENISFRSPRDAQLLSRKKSVEARRQSADPDDA